ncbi:hypothetical protein SprV_0902661400 [Sparganum proliferum]
MKMSREDGQEEGLPTREHRIDTNFQELSTSDSLDGHQIRNTIAYDGIHRRRIDTEVLQNNARVYCSNETTTTLSACGLRGIFIPDNSPDRNPIKNLFALIRRNWGKASVPWRGGVGGYQGEFVVPSHSQFMFAQSRADLFAGFTNITGLTAIAVYPLELKFIKYIALLKTHSSGTADIN